MRWPRTAHSCTNTSSKWGVSRRAQRAGSIVPVGCGPGSQAPRGAQPRLPCCLPSLGGPGGGGGGGRGRPAGEVRRGLAEAAGRARGHEPRRRELESERVLCARQTLGSAGPGRQQVGCQSLGHGNSRYKPPGGAGRSPAALIDGPRGP